jgi:hypothetical protein
LDLAEAKDGKAKKGKSRREKISAAFIYLTNELIRFKAADKASDFHTNYFYFFDGETQRQEVFAFCWEIMENIYAS